LEAAKEFEIKKNASKKLESALRKREAQKIKISEKEVTEVSHETLCEEMVDQTICHEEVIVAILKKFKALGYQSIEKKAPINPRLN
jgi:regulator of sigma D